MVPDRERPQVPPRSFTPEVEAAIERALQEPWQGDAPPEALSRAVKAAAREARDRMLRAEEMLVAFKDLEQRLSAKLSPGSPSNGGDRARLIRALIDAYYLE